jgi:hypothetical protein
LRRRLWGSPSPGQQLFMAPRHGAHPGLVLDAVRDSAAAVELCFNISLPCKRAAPFSARSFRYLLVNASTHTNSILFLLMRVQTDIASMLRETIEYINLSITTHLKNQLAHFLHKNHQNTQHIAGRLSPAPPDGPRPAGHPCSADRAPGLPVPPPSSSPCVARTAHLQLMWCCRLPPTPSLLESNEKTRTNPHKRGGAGWIDRITGRGGLLNRLCVFRCG